MAARTMVSVDELRTLRRSFEESAVIARDLRARLDQQASQDVWHSNAAARFKARWDAQRQQLAQLQSELEGLSQELAEAASRLQTAGRPA